MPYFSSSPNYSPLISSVAIPQRLLSLFKTSIELPEREEKERERDGSFFFAELQAENGVAGVFYSEDSAFELMTLFFFYISLVGVLRRTR